MAPEWMAAREDLPVTAANSALTLMEVDSGSPWNHRGGLKASRGAFVASRVVIIR